MLSKRRYETCTCSAMLGELESSRNQKRFSIIFTYYERGVFFSLESESFRFPQEPILTAPGFLLCAKDSLMWAVKCKKLDFRKSQSIYYQISFENCTCLEIFSCPQVLIENSRHYLLLWKDILQKTVVGCPRFTIRSHRLHKQIVCCVWALCEKNAGNNQSICMEQITFIALTV